jgi:hypothetical protein
MLGVADTLCNAIRQGAEYAAADESLSSLHSLWLDLAEQELMDITGADLPKQGLRGRGPRLVWKSILPEKRGTGHGASAAAALAWLDDMLRDLSRVTVRGEDDADERLGLAAQLLVAMRADRPRNSEETVAEATVCEVEGLIKRAMELVNAEAQPAGDRPISECDGDIGGQRRGPAAALDAWRSELGDLASATRAPGDGDDDRAQGKIR